MGYQTILVQLDTGERCAERVRYATKLALEHDAHLVGMAAADEVRVLALYGNCPAPVALSSEQLLAPRRLAQEALRTFETRVEHQGLRSYETRFETGEAGLVTMVHARYSDLVVIGQSEPQGQDDTPLPDFPQYLVIHAGRPVLVIPYVGEFRSPPRRIDVAWDASREAARAVSDALPLLKRADRVRILTFNAAASWSGHGAVPGADAATYLARHGVKVEVTQEQSTVAVGEALLNAVSDAGTDLLVMGGYGHARVREMVLGGVTRTLLTEMTVPVLFAH